MREQFGFFAKAPRFFGKVFFKGHGLREICCAHEPVHLFRRTMPKRAMARRLASPAAEPNASHRQATTATFLDRRRNDGFMPTVVVLGEARESSNALARFSSGGTFSSFLRPVIAFGWPWLVLWISIKSWMWALASLGSDASIPALLVTIVVLARPLYEVLWPGNAWKAIGIIVGAAGFCFGVSTWLAPHLAAEGLQHAIHTPSGDEQYAKAVVEKQLLVWFYPEMALLIVIAVVSAIIALSQLGPTIQVLRSIGRRIREYRRYGCLQPDLRELNRTFAHCLTQFACAVLLALAVSEVAIWFNELEDGGSLRLHRDQSERRATIRGWRTIQQQCAAQVLLG